jgi:hypothetical protein
VTTTVATTSRRLADGEQGGEQVGVTPVDRVRVAGHQLGDRLLRQ